MPLFILECSTAFVLTSFYCWEAESRVMWLVHAVDNYITPLPLQHLLLIQPPRPGITLKHLPQGNRVSHNMQDWDSDNPSQVKMSTPILGALSEVSYRGALNGKPVALSLSIPAGGADPSHNSHGTSPKPVQHCVSPHAVHGIL